MYLRRCIRLLRKIRYRRARARSLKMRLCCLSLWKCCHCISNKHTNNNSEFTNAILMLHKCRNKWQYVCSFAVQCAFGFGGVDTIFYSICIGKTDLSTKNSNAHSKRIPCWHTYCPCDRRQTSSEAVNMYSFTSHCRLLEDNVFSVE